MFLLIGKSRMKIRRHTYIALEKGGRLVKVGEVLDDLPVKRTGHVMKNQMKCCHSWLLTAYVCLWLRAEEGCGEHEPVTCEQ